MPYFVYTIFSQIIYYAYTNNKYAINTKTMHNFENAILFARFKEIPY